MMTATSIEAMEEELDRLIGVRERAVGIDLKRTNFKISELQNRIDHALTCIPSMTEKISKEEFERYWACNSGMTVAELHAYGWHCEPCDCGAKSCRGWRMVTQLSTSIDERSAPSTFDYDHQPRGSQPD